MTEKHNHDFDSDADKLRRSHSRFSLKLIPLAGSFGVPVAWYSFSGIFVRALNGYNFIGDIELEEE